MATQGTYTDGYGDVVAFAVDLAPGTGGAPFNVTVYFSSENKFLQCQMYGPDTNHPADPLGQQRFVENLGRAIAQDAQTNPNAPMSARFAFSTDPASAEAFAQKLVTGDGPVKRNCLWSENSDPNTDLTIKVAVNGDNMNSRAELVDANGMLVGQRDSFADASATAEEFDPQNTHPYSKLGVSTDANNKVTAAQVTLDPNVIAAGGSVGQIFGSALGAALGGKDQLTNLVGSAAGGVIGSLIGQKFVQVLATSMTADLSQVSLADVFSSQGINIAGAGIGAVSSFLTAELGSALKIPGFGGTLFNIAGSSLTFSVLSQVVNSHLAFDAAIAAIDWSQAVSGAMNAAQLNLDGVLGGYLAHEFVPAKTHEGAVGGELLGAIGNLILPGGLGSFIGNILGTLIFNHFGTSPSPGAVDLLDRTGILYGFHQYQASDHGTYDFPDKMAPAADVIINAYLRAVNGVALDHSKQVTLGYIVNPDLLFISGTPGHTDHSFTNADDAVHAAALDVLQNTEVIGGDLLLKRAHQNSNRLHRSRGATTRRRIRGGGWRYAKRGTASMACIHKRYA
jgi:hypothetical protein